MKIEVTDISEEQGKYLKKVFSYNDKVVIMNPDYKYSANDLRKMRDSIDDSTPDGRAEVNRLNKLIDADPEFPGDYSVPEKIEVNNTVSLKEHVESKVTEYVTALIRSVAKQDIQKDLEVDVQSRLKDLGL